MKGNRKTPCDLEIRLEDFTAELTRVAYAVVLRHGARDKWLDLQLELWKALQEIVKKWTANDRRCTGSQPNKSRGAGTRCRLDLHETVTDTALLI
jgi:hypothetical protein